MRGSLLIAPLLISLCAWSEEPKLPELAPFLRTVIPAGGQPGKRVEIEGRGRYLDGALELRFTHPDIKADICASSFYELHACIEIGEKVPPGMYEYRLITPRGNFAGRFHVSPIQSVREVEPNNDAAAAQKIALPATIDGLIDSNDYDHFKFHAEAGQTIVFDVVGNRGSSFLDSKLAILDDRGNELQTNDDWYIGGDPHLAFTAPKAGDYIVQISDTNEFGNRDFSYRLIAGAYPYADRSLPAAVGRGATTELELTGANLDKVTEIVLGDAVARGEILKQEGGTLRVRVAVPTSAKAGILPLYLKSKDEYAPAALKVVVSDLHETRLDTPGTREHPHILAPGSAVTGILDRTRGTHYYSVDARAGQTLAMAVDSMKLGYSLDGAISLYDSTGRQLAFQDDPARAGPRQSPELDPYVAHTFEKDGTYLLAVRESGRRTSPRYVYRLSVQPAEPDFALEVQAPTNTLYRGRTGKVEVRVKRRNGWNAPVEVWVEDPPAGLEISRATAEPKNSVYKDACAKEQTVNGTDVELKVRVDASAPGGVFPLRIHARGVMKGRTVEHGAAAVYSSNYIARLSGPLASSEQLAAVTDLPPVVVDVPQNFGITVGKTDKLKVQVRRYDGGATPLKIEPDSLPPGVKLENNVLEPGAGQVELRFITAKDAKPGKHTLAFQVGEVKTPNIEINIAAAPPEAKK